ncbi:MAG: hypothetical protein J1G06_00480 [Oscillospiraceae bacterium]|nr:hypothetical protein [Oscillospiraceae bacterium]
MNRFEKPIIKIAIFSQVIGTTNDPIMVSAAATDTSSIFNKDKVEQMHKVAYDTLKFN